MIVFMVTGTLAFLLMVIVTAVTGMLLMGILGRTRGILKDSVQPAAENARATAQNIKGTVEYVTDTAVKPVVKVYGAAAGARRFVGVVSRFAGKKGA
jgi:hypothetical protein